EGIPETPRLIFEIVHAGHVEESNHDQQQDDRTDENKQPFIRTSHAGLGIDLGGAIHGPTHRICFKRLSCECATVWPSLSRANEHETSLIEPSDSMTVTQAQRQVMAPRGQIFSSSAPSNYGCGPHTVWKDGGTFGDLEECPIPNSPNEPLLGDFNLTSESHLR